MIGTTHFRHHGRFYVSAVIGVAVWTATGFLAGPFRLLVAGDFFCIAYLVLMSLFVMGATPDRLRQRASVEDEGALLIVLLALAAISLSLVSIFTLINQAERPGAFRLAVAIASVPLGWLVLHTIAAFHYAHLYYSEADPDEATRKDARGLSFPGTEEPGAWDFLYYSFVVGMTAQVSDVQVLTTGLRRLTLAHGVVSFFYNTVLVALAVNVAVAQGK